MQEVQPAARGSGEVSLKDLGRLEELVKEKGMEGKVKFIQEMIQADKDKGDKWTSDRGQMIRETSEPAIEARW